MRPITLVGGALVAAALVLGVIGNQTAAIALGIAGVLLLLGRLFRRFGRAGDFDRSGS